MPERCHKLGKIAHIMGLQLSGGKNSKEGGGKQQHKSRQAERLLIYQSANLGPGQTW